MDVKKVVVKIKDLHLGAYPIKIFSAKLQMGCPCSAVHAGTSRLYNTWKDDDDVKNNLVYYNTLTSTCVILFI